MKQSGQKSWVRSIAYINMMYGENIRDIFAPCTYIYDVAIGERVMAFLTCACCGYTCVYAAMSLTRASPHAENIIKLINWP